MFSILDIPPEILGVICNNLSLNDIYHLSLSNNKIRENIFCIYPQFTKINLISKHQLTDNNSILRFNFNILKLLIKNESMAYSAINHIKSVYNDKHQQYPPNDFTIDDLNLGMYLLKDIIYHNYIRSIGGLGNFDFYYIAKNVIRSELFNVYWKFIADNYEQIIRMRPGNYDEIIRQRNERLRQQVLDNINNLNFGQEQEPTPFNLKTTIIKFLKGINPFVCSNNNHYFNNKYEKFSYLFGHGMGVGIYQLGTTFFINELIYQIYGEYLSGFKYQLLNGIVAGLNLLMLKYIK